MADPDRPHNDPEYDDERFEDEGRRSIFSALWFRAILVVIVLGVVAAVAVPYVLELANQPAPRSTALVKPETPPPAPVAPPTPPLERSPAAERSPAVERPPAAEKPAPPPTPTTPAERPAIAKKSDAGRSTVAREQAAPRAAKAPSPTGAAAPSGAYFVQVGAFKNHETAKRLALRLRDMKYNVEESSTTGTKSTRTVAAAPSASAAPAPAGSDRYDVYVTGAAPAEINSKLAAKGLSAEPSGSGVVVKPSLPLRDAVALSKDFAIDGLKVQVRRAGGAAAPAPARSGGGATATSDGTVYRVRVGPFDDKATATSTLRELEQRGYTPFIARGGQ